MKFSVVIPLYNKERHIGRAIESVISQTYTDFELIIVDDGSTDSSIEKAAEYKDPRIRIIKKSNKGVSSARNVGIDSAIYDYIGFLDADDAWKPNFLSTINELIEHYPAAGVYAASYEATEEDGRVVVCRGAGCFKDNWHGIIDDYFKIALKIYLITASTVVVPKNTFDVVGTFATRITRGEDRDMWRRIAMEFPVSYYNKVCATIYADADNRACKKKLILSESSAAYAEEDLAEAIKSGNNSIYFKEYMIGSIIRKADFLISENKSKKARKILNKYRHTRYNKKALIKAYVLSMVPNKLRIILQRRKIKSSEFANLKQ